MPFVVTLYLGVQVEGDTGSPAGADGLVFDRVSCSYFDPSLVVWRDSGDPFGSPQTAFAVTAGALPPGVQLCQAPAGSPAGGGCGFTENQFGLQGIPLELGTYTGSFGASGDYPGDTFSITVALVDGCSLIGVTPGTLRDGQLGRAYSVVLAGDAGVAPYTLDVVAGELPPGLSLASNGTLSGTPTTLGASTFIVRLVDANGCTAVQAITLTIVAAVVVGYDARLKPGITIDLSTGEGAKHASVHIRETPPAGGAAIEMYDPVSQTKLHAGSAVIIEQGYDGKPDETTWELTVQNWDYLFNRRRPFGTWTNISASDIAQELITDFTDGFSGARIQSGLPAVSLTLDGSLTMTGAFAALKGLVPGTEVDIDTEKQVFFGYDAGVGSVTDRFSGDGVTDTFTLTHQLVVPEHGVLGLGYVRYNDGGGFDNESLSVKRDTPGSTPTFAVGSAWAGGATHTPIANASFAVAFLFDDGTESLAVESNEIDIDDSHGWTLTGIPTGGGTVVGRRCYLRYETPVTPAITVYFDVNDNVTTSISNTGSDGENGTDLTNLNVFLAYPTVHYGEPLLAGIWQYDELANTIERTTGAPVTGTNNIEITYGAADQTPEAIIDGSPYLMLAPPIKKTTDLTQLRNRILLRGVGSACREDAGVGQAYIRTQDVSMFVAGERVQILGDIYLVTGINYSASDPNIGLSPGLTTVVRSGTVVRIWVSLDDTDSQTARAAVEGGDGVHEYNLFFSDWLISSDIVGDTGDRALAEYAELRRRGQAELDVFAEPIESVVYYTRDIKSRPGRKVTIDLTAPPISGTFKIQKATIDQIAIDQYPHRLEPRFCVTATSALYTVEDLLRQAITSVGNGSSGASPSAIGSGGSGSGGGAPVGVVIKPDGTVDFAADQSMGGHKLTNLDDPASAQDAATKGYVDAAAPPGGVILASGTVAFTANQSMGGHKLTNVTDPASAQDAATKAYVDANIGGGGGALVLLEQHTASGSASLDFTTAFTSTYDLYVFEFINVLPATDNVDLLLRFSTNGGVSYDSSSLYDFADYLNNTGNFATPAVSGTGATGIKISPTMDFGATTGGFCGQLRIYNPLSAAEHKIVVGDGGAFLNDNQFYSHKISGRYANTAAANAARLLMSTGNIASGTVRCYGVQK